MAKTILRIWSAVVLLALAFDTLASAQAQNWPQRQITILVQTPPGTLLDVPARALARYLSENLGQPVVIENRVGSGGIVLLKAIQNAEPNGYLLGVTAVGPAVIRPILDKSVGFNFDRDFTPIIMLGDIPNTLVASPKIGVNSVAEFVAYAKSHPELPTAHGGLGTIGHLAGILFAQSAGIKLNMVAYRGSAQMINDIVSGEVSAGFPPYNPAARNARIIAVATAKRLDFLPEVPTLAESGYPAVLATTWTAIVGPAHLPAEIVTKLNQAINSWVNQPGQRAQLGAMGFNLAGGDAAAVKREVDADKAKWAAILRENNITLDPQAQ